MTNSIICGNNAQVLAGFPADYIDLTVTSPPYDNLRDYNGYDFDFEAVAQQLWRVTKPGGVVVWVVGDATKDGCESLTSFKQALVFNSLGFNVETMIYEVAGTGAKGSNYLYWQAFEYMFVFSRGQIKTVNRIADVKNNWAGQKKWISPKAEKIKARTNRERIINSFAVRSNIWRYRTGWLTGDDITDHEAPFPEALARDHIISWSNPGDLILAPFCGSGTTLKMAKEQGRNYIGIDISPEYCALSQRRVEGAKVPLFVLQPETNGKPKPEQLELLPE